MMRGFCLPVLFCFSELYARKKNHMAAESKYQNFFTVYCSTKFLFLVLSL